jgi:C4-dicarboxylate-specific signal transduction histidine kinase
MEFVDRYRSVAERPRPRPEPLRLTELTEGIERLMSATLHQRGVTYRSRVTPLDLGVSADRQLLEQALLNLLRNAMDAVAETQQPLIEVGCRAVQGSVEITVADNGPGLDAEERDRIFVPFYSTKAGGSGIGLSLARYVAIAHGGQLEVAAAVPRGTRFTLRLPSPA